MTNAQMVQMLTARLKALREASAALTMAGEHALSAKVGKRIWEVNQQIIKYQ